MKKRRAEKEKEKFLYGKKGYMCLTQQLFVKKSYNNIITMSWQATQDILKYTSS